MEDIMKKIVCIEGMKCAHCSSAVEEELKAAGAEKVKVKLKSGAAVIKGDEVLSDEAITDAVKAAGFEVKSIEIK